jgi:hypothetical protein
MIARPYRHASLTSAIGRGRYTSPGNWYRIVAGSEISVLLPAFHVRTETSSPADWRYTPLHNRVVRRRLKHQDQSPIALGARIPGGTALGVPVAVAPAR